jgi:Zn-dependent protease
MSISLPFIIALVISISVHEFCHAWAATYLGDETARLQGRLTLNPLAHLDPIGTILLFIAGFGWGRPVPFNPYNLRDPRVGAALISIAGPLSNFVLMVVFAFSYRFLALFTSSQAVAGLSPFIPFMLELFAALINLNLILGLFNLLPIPPLDGAKIFSLLLPGHLLQRVYQYRNYGYVALIFLVFSDSLFGVSFLGLLVGPLFDGLWDIILP